MSMLTVTATFDLTLLHFVAANVICLLFCVLVVKHQSRGVQRNARLIATTVADYFRECGNEVQAECIPQGGGKTFVALIRSEPSRRIRNTQIAGLALIAHVRKHRGLDLEKVYWSFQGKTKQDAVQQDLPGEAPATTKGDEYFDEELSTVTKPPGYRVRELSRERFDAMASKLRASLGAQPEPVSVA
jgi:hypothetical protein